jgi:hypothetical protein
MNRTLAFFAALALVPAAAFAQDASDNHRVTVRVMEINTLEVRGGDLVLTLDALDPADASLFVPARDESAALAWSTNGADRKITVESDLASPRYTLSVAAFDVRGGGSALGSVVLDAANGAQDLISGISRETADAHLEYVARADVADGIGSETHTVTYTLTAM